MPKMYSRYLERLDVALLLQKLSWKPHWWRKRDTCALCRGKSGPFRGRPNGENQKGSSQTVWSHIYTFHASNVTWLVQDSLHLIPNQNDSARRWCSSSFWPGYLILLQRLYFFFHFIWLFYVFLPTRVKCHPLVLPRFSSLCIPSILSVNEGDVSLVVWHLCSMNCLMFYNTQLQSAVHAR